MARAIGDGSSWEDEARDGEQDVKRQPGGGDVVVMVDCGLSGFVEGGRTVVAVYSNFLFATLARSWAEKGKAVDQLGIALVLLPRWCIHAT
jgi:hypothetical protein